jgi:hypothetical protein
MPYGEPTTSTMGCGRLDGSDGAAAEAVLLLTEPSLGGGRERI